MDLTTYTGLVVAVGTDDEPDMDFLIKTEHTEISSHRSIVGCHSEILNKIIYGTDKWVPSNLINIHSISSIAFMQVLRFFYEKQITITDENVWELYKTAHYLDLIDLTKMCVEFIDKSINYENVCLCLEHFLLFDKDSKLTMKCLNIIAVDVSMFLDNLKLFQMSYTAVKLILSSDKLNILEIHLFKELMKLAESICYEKDLPANGQNLRDALGDLFYLIRFPIMNSDEFDQCILSGCFSNEEQIKIQYCISYRQFDCSPFSNVPRLEPYFY